MNNKVKKYYKNKWQHFDSVKYWKRRNIIVDPKIKKNRLKCFVCLRYIKRSECFNCAYISTYLNGGAVFKSAPNMPHGLNGIIIGDNVYIGNNCTIMHRVTIAEGTKDNPTIIGDNVFIGAGAVIRSSKK